MTESNISVSLDEAKIIAAQCIQETDFEVLDIQEYSVSKDSGGGFMSDYIRLEIRVRLQTGSKESRKFFAKTVPRSPGAHRDFVEAVKCYVKETGFYEKILPLLLKHQEKRTRNDDPGIIGRWSPQCFLTREDIIVMEDLTSINFKVPNNRELFNWHDCVTVLKKAASFHAATIIFEEKERNVTGSQCRIGDLHPECFTDVLSESMPDDETKGWFITGVRAAVALIPFITKFQRSMKLQKVIQEKLPNALRSIEGLATSQKYRNVVCHGDLWSSNILFRHGEDNSSQIARFVDYQILRYSPPATDIAIFIYTTTNRQFRERHINEMLKVYYDEFASELRNNGISECEVLSFQELRESFEFYSPGARAIAVLYYQLITLDSETKNTLFSSPENYNTFFLVDRIANVRQCFQEDEIYRYRLQGALEELVEKDILNSKT